MIEVTPILCDNIMEKDLDEIRMSLFSILEPHDSLTYFDNAEYVRLLGEYSTRYQYASELYVHCISLVRHYTNAKEPLLKVSAMDRRDMIEQYLKAVKFNYESLSRKVTIFASEREDVR